MSIQEPSALLEQNVPDNPLTLFAQWYLAAESAELPEPSAMTLATASADGVPDARMVLMRGFDERGFAFYTNFQSRKADQLQENPRAALVFYWSTLERQIRVTGRVERVSPEESDAYFRKRPLGHQLSAWASPQSQVVAGRQFLEERLEAMRKKFQPSDEVPRPAHWGGFRVVPDTIEFWQGGEHRLHDRLRYRREDGGWIIERLAP